MDSKTSITFEGDYIFVQVSGENSYERSLDLWKNIAKACENHQCFKILGVSNMKNPLKIIDAYNHIDIAKETGHIPYRHVAWVEMNPDAIQSLDFIETVISNRGLANVRIFSDETEARKWLLEQ